MLREARSLSPRFVISESLALSLPHQHPLQCPSFYPGSAVQPAQEQFIPVATVTAASIHHPSITHPSSTHPSIHPSISQTAPTLCAGSPSSAWHPVGRDMSLPSCCSSSGDGGFALRRFSVQRLQGQRSAPLRISPSSLCRHRPVTSSFSGPPAPGSTSSPCSVLGAVPDPGVPIAGGSPCTSPI